VLRRDKTIGKAGSALAAESRPWKWAKLALCSPYGMMKDDAHAVRAILARDATYDINHQLRPRRHFQAQYGVASVLYLAEASFLIGPFCHSGECGARSFLGLARVGQLNTKRGSGESSSTDSTMRLLP
jgi:hypothetical protein